MSQFLTQEQDALKLLREREPGKRSPFVVELMFRYPGMDADAANHLMEGLRKKGLVKHEGDWKPV